MTKMTILQRAVVLCILQIVVAQVQIKPSPLTGIMGQNLTVTCTFPVNTNDIILRVGDDDISSLTSKFLGGNPRGSTAFEYRYGPLEASDDGAVFECDDTTGNRDSTHLFLIGKSRL